MATGVQPLSVTDPEEGGDFIERFVLRFGNFFVGEDPEEGEEDAEWEEGVVFESRLHRWEPDAHEEVGTPAEKSYQHLVSVTEKQRFQLIIN